MSVTVLFGPGVKFLVQLQYVQRADKYKVHGRNSITGVSSCTNKKNDLIGTAYINKIIPHVSGLLDNAWGMHTEWSTWLISHSV